MVADAIALYDQAGDDAFDLISDPDGGFIDGEFYVFVLSTSGTVYAHSNPDLLGQDIFDLQDSQGVYVVRGVLNSATASGGWSEYRFTNPASQVEEPKRSWSVLHDGVVFGSGYYITEAEWAQIMLERAAALYEAEGEQALMTISQPSSGFAAGEIYVFALGPDGVSLAHAADPSLVGTDRSGARDSEGELFIQKLIDAAVPEGAWVLYRRLNPVSGVEEIKRSRVVEASDGVVLGAGYYPTSEQFAQQMVNDAIDLYDELGEDAFARISDPEGEFIYDDFNALVLTRAGVVQAYPVDPSLAGSNIRFDWQDSAGNYVIDLLMSVASPLGAWYDYKLPNPTSGIEESRLSWSVLYDGHVFSSSFRSKDSSNPKQLVKRLVNNALRFYEAEGEEMLEEISDPQGGFINGEVYVFALSPTGVSLAHAANPSLVGQDRWDARDSRGELFIQKIIDAAADEDDGQDGSSIPSIPHDLIDDDAVGDSFDGTWVVYRRLNPVSGLEELKRSWVVEASDGVVFGAGYYLSEEELVRLFVTDAIKLYEIWGEEDAFEYISLPGNDFIDGQFYVHVLTTAGVSLAHAVDPSFVGQDFFDLQNSEGTYVVRSILSSASAAGGWSEYKFRNPVSGEEEPKRSFSVLHDGYVFASGYYLSEQSVIDRVKQLVTAAAALYESEGEEAFAQISDPDGDFKVGEYYVFGLSADGVSLAHAADPSLVGSDRSGARDSQGELFIPRIIDSATPEGAWVVYRRLNPVSGVEELKRSWVVEVSEGVVLGAGYYLTEEELAQQLTNNAVALYEEVGEGAFAQISDPEGEFIDGEYYVYALAADGVSLAHAANPSLVGTDRSDAVDSRGELFIPRIIDAATPEGAWVVYRRLNPVSDVEELKRSWVVETSDGVVFGSGFYISEEEYVTLLASNAIALYDAVGEEAFEQISDPEGDFVDDELYVVIYSTDGRVLAHAADPSLVGQDQFDLQDSEGTYVVRNILSASNSPSLWAQYRLLNPVTGVEEPKRTYSTLYRGYVFSAGFYLDEEEWVKRLVAEAAALYEEMGEDAFARISNPNGDFKVGELYVFGLSADGVSLAHAANPSLVGTDRSDARDSQGELFIPRIIDAATPEGAWVVYRRLNPVTGVEEYKRSWVIEIEDGSVLGAGYYFTELEWVQRSVAEAAALYEEMDEEAFAQISDPNGDFRVGELYVFGLSADGVSLAHAANPALVGTDRSGARDSRGELFIPRIIDAATPEGAWVVYRRLNPVTGVEEFKRSWVREVSNGVVLGAGYYLSEEERVQQLVVDAVELYESEGEQAFARISNPEGSFKDGEHYVYVVGTDGSVRADAADLSQVGQDLYGLRDSEGNYILREITRAATPSGGWTEFRQANPVSGEEELKRSWVRLVDDLIFGAGYYFSEDELAKSQVARVVISFEEIGRLAIVEISDPDSDLGIEGIEMFALSSEGAFLANSADPSLVLENAANAAGGSEDPFVSKILEAASPAGSWVVSPRDAASTETGELKRSWVVRVGDYVVGASYYLTEKELAQTLVADAISRYNEVGFAAFGEISRPGGGYLDGEYYVYVLNMFGVGVAHAGNPSLVGRNLFDLQDSDNRYVVRNVLDSATAEGSWLEYRFPNPASGVEEPKRSWAVLYDGYVFGSGYYFTEDSWARQQVADAIALYDELGGEEAFTQISDASGKFRNGEFYVSVTTPEGEVRAHAGDPSLVGGSVSRLTDSEGVLVHREVSQAASAEGAWVEYMATNPLNLRDELRRTWVVLHDGLIFGSGYHLSEEEVVERYLERAINRYKEVGEQAFEEFSDPDGSYVDGELYVFVLDTEGVSLANAADPSIVGENTYDLQDGSGNFFTRNIIASAAPEGAWTEEYWFTNPETGRVGQKRSYVVLYDGIIFGSGYYLDS